VTQTGDTSVLSEKLPFREAEALQPEEVERYGYYPTTGGVYDLYEHCRRALEKGFTQGRHGLPLMGGGDWNDGMNQVGIEGRGESVWLGWFLCATLDAFAPLCDLMEDEERAARYRGRAKELQEALAQHGWDGDWYVRAYFDDGTPLGSAQNLECQIASIAQSWAVLSAAADPERALTAMESLWAKLIREDDRLALLFTPPFDKTELEPGYIKGYPPGVRENGGQYTHAALWAAWAFAQLGQGDRAERLFRLLNPVLHSSTGAQMARYKVEPYAVAADVYSHPAHLGRGGWTWYTGSAGWMYRLGVEAILGLRRKGDTLLIDPCIPREWSGYALEYRHGETHYRIAVNNPKGVQRGVQRIDLDGEKLPTGEIPLLQDGGRHEIEVWMG
jgi:cyclic beta-1,2-glucan synthetase